MKHYKKLLGTLVLATAFLTACQADEPKESKAEQEEAVAETKVDMPTQESFVHLIDQHFTGIMKGLSDATYDFNLEDGDVTDAIYDAMKDRFTNFATQSYIDGDLKAIAKDYCYIGCDMAFFPYHFEGALTVELEQMSAEEVKLSATHPADMMSPNAFKDIVYLKYDGGLWKIDKVDYEETNLSLTQELAEKLLADWDYAGVKFLEERAEGYVYESNGTKVLVSKKTGFIEENVEVPTTPVSKPSASGSIFETYEAKLNATSIEADHIVNSFTGYTTPEINENATQVFNVWDALLNDMYQTLKKNLPAAEFTELQKEQRKWITERDDYAEYMATEEAAGGTLYTAIYINAQSDYTAQRCSDFLYDFMVGM